MRRHALSFAIWAIASCFAEGADTVAATAETTAIAIRPADDHRAELEWAAAYFAAPDPRGRVLGVASVGAVLGMLRDGAAGATRAELTRALGGATPVDIPPAKMASAIWARAGIRVDARYREMVAAHYGAAVFELPARDPGAAINGWVAKATEGLIPEIVDPVAFAADLVAVSGFYFKGHWTTPFAQSDHVGFRTERGVTTRPFMQRTGKLPAISGDIDAVQVPYADTTLVLEIVVAKAPDWSVTHWPNLSAAVPREVQLVMPKFRLENRASLRSLLQRVGLDVALRPGAADFSPITGGPNALALTDVLHRAVIAVDELGTEAAAATAAELFGSLPALRLLVDQPFYFALRDRATGAFVLIGRFTGID